VNTSRAGAEYELAYRRMDAKKNAHPRQEIRWQPPRPRQHSTGFDSMRWTLDFDDEGVIYARSEPIFYEFKRGKMSCAAAYRLREALEEVRPAFSHVLVVHRTKLEEFCEH
jgi:hypothetical protein